MRRLKKNQETDVEIEKLLENHPNASNFVKLSFGRHKKLNSSELLAIAARCPNITNLSIYVSEILDVKKLVMKPNYFTKLEAASFEFCDVDSFGTEGISRLLKFVLLHALAINSLELDFITEWEEENEELFPLDRFFNDILPRNPLKYFKKFQFSDYSKLCYSIDTLKMLADLPSITEINFHGGGPYGRVAQSLKSYVKMKNYDVKFTYHYT